MNTKNEDFYRLFPSVNLPLDSEFCPPIKVMQNYQKAIKNSGNGVPLVIGLERENGFLSRFETEIMPLDDSIQESIFSKYTFIFIERLVKFFLWSRGGWKLYIGGPRSVGEYIKHCYCENGSRSFDVNLLRSIYEKPFEVEVMSADMVPPEKGSNFSIGGHFKGCRIGFDIGASDYKVSAVIDGKIVFSEEVPWDPKEKSDPNYHYTHVEDALKKAASFLPRVDAIGGSSAGVLVNNKVMVASLFRSIPQITFEREIRPMFLRLMEKWGKPFKIINDGDVAALAGALSLGRSSILGIAMGSSEAAGFITSGGDITGWLNELAMAPVDFNPESSIDEWSGDYGTGSLYFSQAAVNKLALTAGFEFPLEVKLPERLLIVQEKVKRGDQRAIQIFETIGVYLGYTIPFYAKFYDFQNILILGRVTSGPCGNIIVRAAKRVLEGEFPELASYIKIHMLDEKSRRVGQSVAAASLPELDK